MKTVRRIIEIPEVQGRAAEVPVPELIRLLQRAYDAVPDHLKPSARTERNYATPRIQYDDVMSEAELEEERRARVASLCLSLGQIERLVRSLDQLVVEFGDDAQALKRAVGGERYEFLNTILRALPNAKQEN